MKGTVHVKSLHVNLVNVPKNVIKFGNAKTVLMKQIAHVNTMNLHVNLENVRINVIRFGNAKTVLMKKTALVNLMNLNAPMVKNVFL